jgi:hypothetical protein
MQEFTFGIIFLAVILMLIIAACAWRNCPRQYQQELMKIWKNRRSNRNNNPPSRSSSPIPIILKLSELKQQKQPRSTSVHRNRSVPLNSDDFFTIGFRSGFRRTNSDQSLSVSLISNEFLSKFSGIYRNFSDEIRTGIL